MPHQWFALDVQHYLHIAGRRHYHGRRQSTLPPPANRGHVWILQSSLRPCSRHYSTSQTSGLTLMLMTSHNCTTVRLRPYWTAQCLCAQCDIDVVLQTHGLTRSAVWRNVRFAFSNVSVERPIQVMLPLPLQRGWRDVAPTVICCD